MDFGVPPFMEPPIPEPAGAAKIDSERQPSGANQLQTVLSAMEEKGDSAQTKLWHSYIV